MELSPPARTRRHQIRLRHDSTPPRSASGGRTRRCIQLCFGFRVVTDDTDPVEMRTAPSALQQLFQRRREPCRASRPPQCSRSSLCTYTRPPRAPGTSFKAVSTPLSANSVRKGMAALASAREAVRATLAVRLGNAIVHYVMHDESGICPTASGGWSRRIRPGRSRCRR